MSKSLRCSVELEIHSVHTAGTWLEEKEDVFLSVQLFGQARQTRMAGCVFPLFFRDVLKFDKVFLAAYDPTQVADKLLNETVRIELLQMSELFRNGRVLAWYESPAKPFLFPSPFASPASRFPMREVTMERNMSFPGVRPRLEFSCRSSIHESAILSTSFDFSDVDSKKYPRSRSRGVAGTRSMQDRPPFVIRKIDDDLIGRKPTMLRSLSSRSLYLRSRSYSPKRIRKEKYFESDDDEYYNNFNNSYNPEYYINSDFYKNQSSGVPYDVDRYEARLERIKARIDNALETDRRLDLCRSMNPNFSLCKCTCSHHRPCYCCHCCSKELQEARRRKCLYAL